MAYQIVVNILTTLGSLLTGSIEIKEEIARHKTIDI